MILGATGCIPMDDAVDRENLGWSEIFEVPFLEAASRVADAVAARIVREDRGLYRAIAGGTSFGAEVTGAFRNAQAQSKEYPAVGDWVVATRVQNEAKLRVHEVLPRKTAFTRTAAGGTSEVQVVAANVDSVFIVVGLDGDFNPRRVERYVALAYESGAQPVIILSKSDLSDALGERIGEIEEVALGVPVHPVSSIQHRGIEALTPYLRSGQTVACLGSSGAGKSTLINALLGEETMATGATREDDSRGRHTTTHRQLVTLPGGGSLIDTPGMRELQLTGDEESLSSAFEDVEGFAEDCRFRDCTHESEPGCAIRAAIDRGDLESARYRSYQKLQRELAYIQRRQSDSFEHEERKRNKSLGKLYKRIQNEKKNR